MLLRCRLLDGAKRFGAHGGRRGAGHTVAAARLQLVYIVIMTVRSVNHLLSDGDAIAVLHVRDGMVCRHPISKQS